MSCPNYGNNGEAAEQQALPQRDCVSERWIVWATAGQSYKKGCTDFLIPRRVLTVLNGLIVAEMGSLGCSYDSEAINVSSKNLSSFHPETPGSEQLSHRQGSVHWFSGLCHFRWAEYSKVWTMKEAFSGHIAESLFMPCGLSVWEQPFLYCLFL